ncbi:MAG: MFS transporter [bacterium]|nr:MFS transporter [bacterium]
MKKIWNKDLTLLLLGQSVSRLGDSAHHIALMWFILEKTGSSAIMGTLSALAYIPSLILGPFAGVIVDKYSRKKIILLTDFIRGLIVGLLALFFFTKGLNITEIFILTVLLGISSAFFNPCIPSSIPEMVEPENLPRANSLFSIAGRVTEIIGPSVGGILYKFIGAGLLFTFNAFSFFIASICTLFIKIPQRYKDGKINFIGDIGEVLRRLKENKDLMTLGITAAVLNFFYVPFFILLPVYIKNYLHLDASVYGFVLGAGGVGSLIGLLITSVISPSGDKKYNMFRFSLIGQGAFIGLLALPLSSIQLIILFFIIQLLNIFVNIYINVTFQLMVPSEERGRFFGLLGLFVGGLQPISMSLSGIIAEYVKIPIIFIFCTTVILLMSWKVITIKGLRNLFIIKEKGKEEEILVSHT